MNDAIYIGLLVGFFVVAALYAHFCAKLQLCKYLVGSNYAFLSSDCR
jgi:hypothetical protein